MIEPRGLLAVEGVAVLTFLAVLAAVSSSLHLRVVTPTLVRAKVGIFVGYHDKACTCGLCKFVHFLAPLLLDTADVRAYLKTWLSKLKTRSERVVIQLLGVHRDLRPIHVALSALRRYLRMCLVSSTSRTPSIPTLLFAAARRDQPARE